MRSRDTADEVKRYCKWGQEILQMRSRDTADEIKRYGRWTQEVRQIRSEEMKMSSRSTLQQWVQEVLQLTSRGIGVEVNKYCRWDQEVLQMRSRGTADETRRHCRWVAAEVGRTKMRILLLFMQTTGSTVGVRIWRVYIHRVKSTGFYVIYKGLIISWSQLHEETKWVHEYSTIPAGSKCTSVLIHHVKKDCTICTWYIL
jgi:hypothetical protein